MVFKKVHKRSDQLQRRQILPTVATTSATSTNFSRGQMAPSVSPGASTSSNTSTRNSSSSTVSSTVTTSATSTSSTPVQTTAPPQNSNTSVPRVTRTSTQHVSSTSSAPRSTGTSTGDDDGFSIGTIAGGAVAGIIAIGVISAFLVWFIRRRKRNRDIDEEPFNRNSFLRHSTAIPDDDSGLPPRQRPAPDMIERQATPVYGGGMQNYNNMPPQNSFGYSTQPSYANPVVYSPQPSHFGPGGAPATPLPYGMGAPYDQYDNGRQMSNPGGYADLTRGHDDPAFAPYPPQQFNDAYSTRGQPTPPPKDLHSPNGPSFPELTPATAAAQRGHVVDVRSSAYDERQGQLGFTPAAGAQHHGAAPHGKTHRPDTVYDPEDAYGGI